MDDQRDSLKKAADHLRRDLADTETMLKAIEGARMQLSSTADELFARVEILTARVHSHRVALDKLMPLIKQP